MEIAIVAKAKQGYIYRHMVENKLSASELARRLGLHKTMMGKIINFQWLPPTKRNRRKMPGGDITDRLEQYFRVPIDFLFPPELTTEIAQKLALKRVHICEVETISLQSIPEKYLIAPDEAETDDLAETVEKLLSTLEPREEKCLRLRYGIRFDKEKGR